MSAPRARELAPSAVGILVEVQRLRSHLTGRQLVHRHVSRNAERASVLDGVPQALPALALADKVLGKAEKLGLIDASDTPAIPMDDEGALGKLLLAIVSSARAAGLEPERALREATRELQVEIRSFELDTGNDAGGTI
jgi:hypothetical protein